ncbi:MAG: outer membrane protein beta-barrel protein [Bacteroidota bacterium]|nr:outer membrane protein beta-barrel protein [Bacteroidota bacterium]
MRSLFAIFFALFLCSAHAEGPYVGFKLQGTFSTLKPSGGDAAATDAFNANKKLYLGPEAGITILKRINNYIAFAPEVNFSMKGLKYNDGASYRIRRYMQAEVPMVFKVGYGREHFFIYATGGGYATVDIGVKDIEKPVDGKKQTTRLYFANLPNKRFDAGIATGGGAMYIGKHGMIDLAFNYHIGMIKQYKTVESGQPNPKWKSFGVSLAYMWKS